MRTLAVVLKHGIRLGEERYRDVVLREPSVADYIEAEKTSPIYQPYAFKTALVGVLIEKVSGFDGVVTFDMLKELKPTDMALLAKGLETLEDEEGNA